MADVGRIRYFPVNFVFVFFRALHDKSLKDV